MALFDRLGGNSNSTTAFKPITMSNSAFSNPVSQQASFNSSSGLGQIAMPPPSSNGFPTSTPAFQSSGMGNLSGGGFASASTIQPTNNFASFAQPSMGAGAGSGFGMMGGSGFQQPQQQRPPMQSMAMGGGISAAPAKASSSSSDPFSKLVSLDVGSLSNPNKPAAAPGPSLNQITSQPMGSLRPNPASGTTGNILNSNSNNNSGNFGSFGGGSDSLI